MLKKATQYVLSKPKGDTYFIKTRIEGYIGLVFVSHLVLRKMIEDISYIYYMDVVFLFVELLFLIINIYGWRRRKAWGIHTTRRNIYRTVAVCLVYMFSALYYISLSI